MYLMDLEPNELFIWPQQPMEIHKMIGSCAEGTDKVLARCVAWKNGEAWIFASRHMDQEWNAYADVKRIEVNINLL